MRSCTIANLKVTVALYRIDSANYGRSTQETFLLDCTWMRKGKYIEENALIIEQQYEKGDWNNDK